MGQKFTTSDQDNDSWIDGNKKLFAKSFEILFISSLSFFSKGNCSEVHTGGWWFDDCGTSNLNGILQNDFNDLYPSTTQNEKKYPFGEKRRLESPSWLFGPHSPLFQLKLITCSNYYLLLQQLLDSQFNI